MKLNVIRCSKPSKHIVRELVIGSMHVVSSVWVKTYETHHLFRLGTKAITD